MRPELTKAIDLLQRNSPEAVDEALGLLQNTVYSFSMKVCGHPEDAEDTMQEVLFRSLKYLNKIQDPRALSVWLYTVTRNRCWRMRRKPANGTKHHVSLEELMPDDAELARLLADGAPSPEGKAVQAEQQQLVQRAVLQIPIPLRLVLVLHDMEELSTEEVAQVLGLQTGTVRVRLHRARLAVRKEMSRWVHAAAISPARQKRGRKIAKRDFHDSEMRSAECSDLFAKLSEYVDGRVDPVTCEQMQQHILGCPSCVAFLQDLQGAIDRCRALKADCDPAVANRLRSLLTREYLRLIGTPLEKNSTQVM